MHLRLIFNELKVAEEIIENGFSGGRINYKEVSLLAKYYRWIEELGKGGIERKLIEFCSKQDNKFNEIDYAPMLKTCINRAMNYKFRNVSPVCITKEEIDKIGQFKDFRKQKFLFVLLAYAKALKFSTTKNADKRLQEFGYYLSFSFLKECRYVAGFDDNLDEAEYWLHDYYLARLLTYTKSQSLKFSFVDEKGIPEIIIETEERMIDKFIDYCGGEIIYCEECGGIIQTGDKIKKYNMHKSCYKKHLNNIKVESNKRNRNKNK